MRGRLLAATLGALALLAAAPTADAHSIGQFPAIEAATNALARKYPAAEIPVVYCPPAAGHVHKLRCNYEFLRGFQLCDGYVNVRFRSRRSRRLKTRVRRAYCGVPGGPRRPY